MHPIDEKVRSPIAFLVIFIAFAWIGCAYILGAEVADQKVERMILHPLVPILLILLLLGFRGDDSVRRTITITIAFIVCWLFVRLQSVFMPFIIGFSIAYVVYVALAEIQKIPIPLRKGKKVYLPKRAAIAILVILLIGAMAFFALGIVPQLVSQGGGMKDGIGRFYTKVKDYTTNMLARIEEDDYPFKDRIPEGAVVKIRAYVQEKIPTAFAGASGKLGEWLKGLSTRVLETIGGTIGLVFSMFFILIIFIYAVESFQSHMEKLKNMIPENYRDSAARYAAEIDVNMRAFLKGQLAVIIIIAIISVIAYSIIGVPFALLVGLLAGLCNAIPTIGPALGGGIAVLATSVGFVGAEPGTYTLSSFLIRLVFVLGIVVGIQLLDNSLISPKIMSSALDVHPLVILFAVLLAASLVGAVGALLAIPGIVVCKAFIKVSGEMRTEREAREMQQV
ncbi:AI-2E family transporter [Candidatus Poribacteria bacterium]